MWLINCMFDANDWCSTRVYLFIFLNPACFSLAVGPRSRQTRIFSDAKLFNRCLGTKLYSRRCNSQYPGRNFYDIATVFPLPRRYSYRKFHDARHF